MKEYWYFIAMMLTLGILAGFSGLSTPTGALIANIEPEWDFPTQDFNGKDFTLDLSKAFFDADGDTMTYGAKATFGITTSVNGTKLHVKAQQSGTITLIATDGKSVTQQIINVVV